MTVRSWEIPPLSSVDLPQIVECLGDRVAASLPQGSVSLVRHGDGRWSVETAYDVLFRDGRWARLSDAIGDWTWATEDAARAAWRAAAAWPGFRDRSSR